MNTRWLSVACLTVTLLQGSLAYAASDMFLRIDGVEGESSDERNKGAIDVLSWSWGASNTSGVGGGGTGKVSVQDLSFTKRLDKSSPQLYLRCANGKHFASAQLVLRRTGADGSSIDYYKVTLTDVLVTSVSAGGSTGDDRPMETISLNYTKIEWEYIPVGADGTPQTPVREGWDVAAGTPLP